MTVREAYLDRVVDVRAGVHFSRILDLLEVLVCGDLPLHADRRLGSGDILLGIVVEQAHVPRNGDVGFVVVARGRSSRPQDNRVGIRI